MSVTSLYLDYSAGQLRVSARQTYDEKPPQPKTQRKEAAKVLREALEAVEANTVDDLGQAEQMTKRVYVKSWGVKR